MSFRQQMKPMAIIVAVDQNGGFGAGGKIPWIDEPFAKADLKNFQKITSGHPCIMGRRTHEEMVELVKARNGGKPIKEILPKRKCMVVTRNDKYQAEGAVRAKSVIDAVQNLDEDDRSQIFILGGEKLFIETLPWVDVIHMTLIERSYECDRFFPIKYLREHFTIESGTETKDMKHLKYKRVK